MFANRISFTFDFKGPSYAIDTACSSSLFAMAQAFEDMKTGKCDAAIVAGAGIILKPTMSLQFKRLNMLSPEGIDKLITNKNLILHKFCYYLQENAKHSMRRVTATLDLMAVL